MLRVLDLYYKVQLELEAYTLPTRLVLQSCDFRAGAGNLYFVDLCYKVAICIYCWAGSLYFTY